MTTKRTQSTINSGAKTKGTPGKAIKPAKGVLHKRWLEEHGAEYRARLLQNIKAQLPKLMKLLREADRYSGGSQDPGCQRWQAMAREIRDALQELLPDRPMHKPFCELVAQVAEMEIDPADNTTRFEQTQIISAFLHAQLFLEIACKVGRDRKSLPDESDEDWGTLLNLFDLR